jgi:two-component system NtrC family sensor kinase
LAAGIAHEINTPLQFVGDSVSFLSDAVDELLILTGAYRETLHLDLEIPLAERRRALAQAEEIADLDYLLERIPAAFRRAADGVERVRSIVQAMKHFSHTGPAEMAPADLNEAIETTLEVCRGEYKYIAEVTFSAGELPPLTCEISEINQLLLNLIINAAQAVGEHDRGAGAMGTIEIETSCDGDFVTIRITDDGPGIPPELQERIYEPFFTTKEVGKGTGQGLALARTTVQRHAGMLECRSVPGQGTTFTIRLPLEPHDAPAGTQADRRAMTSQSHTASTTGTR